MSLGYGGNLGITAYCSYKLARYRHIYIRSRYRYLKTLLALCSSISLALDCILYIALPYWETIPCKRWRVAICIWGRYIQFRAIRLNYSPR